MVDLVLREKLSECAIKIEDKLINFYKIIKKKIKFDLPKKIIKNDIKQVPNDIDSLYNLLLMTLLKIKNDKKSKRKKKKIKRIILV